MCGLLHCQNGGDEPVHPEARSLSFFNLRTQHDQQKIQCQYVFLLLFCAINASSHLSFLSPFFRYVASTRKFSYVPEGASCDEGRFCFQKRCIKPSAIAVHSKCPKGRFIDPRGDPAGAGEYIHPAVRRNLPIPGFASSTINITCSGRGVMSI